MKDLYTFIQRIKQHPTTCFALATVIHVDGSAYRHEGAKMLFSSEGASFGLISGGCLEADLQYHAQEVMVTGKPKQITYDLKDEEESGWGRGAGCNGKVTVLLEPIQWGHGYINTIEKALQQKRSVIFVRKMEEDSATNDKDWCVIEEVNEMETAMVTKDKKLEQELQDFLKKRGCHLKLVHTNDGTESFLFEKVEGPEPLIIFGAGRDAEPLVDMAANLSFSPIVIDPREERCNVEFFPRAEELLVQDPSDYMRENAFLTDAFVVIMTHDFQKDKFIVNQMMGMEERPRYVAVLGPRKRTERLLGGREIPDWLYSPAGIPIDAETHEEIAVSIVGQLVQIRNKHKFVYRRSRKKLEKQKEPFEVNSDG